MKTKDELMAENAKLLVEVNCANTNDLDIRKSISKMLGAPCKKRSQYDYTEEVMVYSWADIFFNLGKVMHAQKQLQYVSDVETLRLDVQEIRIKMKENDLKEPIY